jgi:hypothetical protein
MDAAVITILFGILTSRSWASQNSLLDQKHQSFRLIRQKHSYLFDILLRGLDTEKRVFPCLPLEVLLDEVVRDRVCELLNISLW